jgi:hypothetical protein
MRFPSSFMGHYCAEMFPNGEDRDFSYRWAKYQQACAREINKIISRNPIQFEKVVVGERVNLYSPLNRLSQVRFDDDKPHIIKEFFGSSARYYGPEMWALSDNRDFVVYDKRKGDLTFRISPILNNCIDMFPAWIYFRYFEK